MNDDNLLSLDVRPIIAKGNDPFKEIMETVNKLNNKQTLEIINSFEPIPLINKLKREGYITWTEKSDTGIVHTYFKKTTESKSSDESLLEKTGMAFDEKYKQFVGKLQQIDVRNLEMPEPMTTILEELEMLPIGNALFVEHKKVPQFLLPELKVRNFEILYNMKSENHVQLLIFKG